MCGKGSEIAVPGNPRGGVVCVKLGPPCVCAQCPPQDSECAGPCIDLLPIHDFCVICALQFMKHTNTGQTMVIRDIISQQREEMKDRIRERYVERIACIPEGDDALIRVITGPRRAGKSFLAMHLIHAREPHGYVNFDHEQLIDVDSYDELMAAVNAVYDNPKHLLLDEIQNLPRWELLVNRLQRQGFHLFLTGSNAHLLSSELAPHLTGRHIPIVLFPFTFQEYVAAVDKEFTATERQQAFLTYLERGGMPEPLVRDMEWVGYLRTLWDSILYKDIVRRHRIRSVAGLEDLATYLLTNMASEFSARRLTEVTQCRSVHTVQKYIGHLSEAFLFFTISRFSPKARAQAKANKKIYCIDNGFVTARGFRISENRGPLLENLVAIALQRERIQDHTEIYYWKGPQQQEVDFAVRVGGRFTQLIQVCWDPQEIGTRSREVRALIHASQALSCEDLVVLTAAMKTEETVEWFGAKRLIRYVPFTEWVAART